MLTIEVKTKDITELSERAAKVAKSGGMHVLETALKKLKAYFTKRLQYEANLVRWRGVLADSVRILEEHKKGFVVGPDPSKADNVNYVLDGTDPHTPPFIPIYMWAKSKLGVTEGEAWQIWHGIRLRGTSVWATRQGWGTHGENPFVDRVAKDEMTKDVLEGTASELAVNIIMQLAGDGSGWHSPSQRLGLPGE
jgi:hypothetical protein